MKAREIFDRIEALADLSLQEDYDNSGLQVGEEESEVEAVLLSLDITEEVIDEAYARGCNLIISHHPLIFKALHCVSNKTYQQRCVCSAIRKGIILYSAHTNLDNAVGGVNYRMAQRLGLSLSEDSIPLIGRLPSPMPTEEFLDFVKEKFEVQNLRHSAITKAEISTVALCGGAGAFLRAKAAEAGADCFITGEFHYHDYFEAEGLLLVELGHYQSEQFTVDLLQDYLREAFPSLRVEKSCINTNPILYR